MMQVGNVTIHEINEKLSGVASPALPAQGPNNTYIPNPWVPYPTPVIPAMPALPPAGHLGFGRNGATTAYETVQVDNNKTIYEFDARFVKLEDVSVEVVGDEIHVKFTRNFGSALTEDAKTVNRTHSYRYPPVDHKIKVNFNTAVIGAALEDGVLKILVCWNKEEPKRTKIKVV